MVFVKRGKPGTLAIRLADRVETLTFFRSVAWVTHQGVTSHAQDIVNKIDVAVLKLQSLSKSELLNFN